MLPSRMLATRPISVKAVPRLTVVQTPLKIEASWKIGSTVVFGFFIDFFQIVGNLDKSKVGRLFSNSFQAYSGSLRIATYITTFPNMTIITTRSNPHTVWIEDGIGKRKILSGTHEHIEKDGETKHKHRRDRYFAKF